MANNNEDLDALNAILRRSREVTEEDILAREGYARNQDGILRKIESASKRRADVEEKIYKQIEATFGKEEALANRKIRSQEKQLEEYEKQAGAMGYLIKSNGEFVKTTVELTKEQKKILENYRDINDKAEKLAKTLEAPGKAFNELSTRLNSTKAIMGEFSSKILESTKGSMGMTAAYQLGSAALEGMFNATKVMTSSLYAGERGAKVGAKAVSAFADSISTALKGIGAAMMFIPGLGIAAKVAGAAITLLGVAAEAAAEMNRKAAEQNDNLYESFTKLSEAGLAGAKGMTGIFETVQTLGMTTAELEKFNTLLVSSSRDLKMFGGTSAAGAEKFAGVAGEMVKSGVGQKLEMLGVTADQQREHTLKYMANQTRLGLIQGKSQQELVKGAAAYVQELDKLSMLTGATRKEQEEAQNAVNAIDEIRAAMEDAEAKGDKGEQARLKKYYDLAVDLQQQGLTRGAAGAARYGAAGAPTDEASAAFMVQMPNAIKAIENGMKRTDVLVASAEDVKKSQRDFAGAKRVGADLSGLQTDKTGTQIDFSKRVLGAKEEADKKGVTVEKYLDDLQKEREAGKDQVTKDNVEARRLQQAAAQQLDSVVFSFNAAAKLNKDASQLFNSAVTKFNNTVGAKPITGGNIQTNVSGGANPSSTGPAPAPTPMASTGGGAATGNPNLTRQSSRARGSDIPQTQPTTAPAPIPSASNAPPNAGAKTMGAMAEKRKAGLGGASQGVPSTAVAPSTSTSTAPIPSASNAPPNAGAKTMGSMAEKRKADLGGASQGVQTPLPSNVTPNMTDSLFNFGSRSGSKSNFEQLSSSIKERIINAAKEFNSLTNNTISINSAKRDPEDQQRLWDESVAAGRPGKTAKNMPIGRPGTSKHERGMAVDIQNYTDPKAVAAMNNQGLFQTVPKDPVHFEMARFGGSFDGPDSGYPVMMHGSEVVIPKPQFDGMTNGINKESMTTATQNINSTNNTSIESPSAILKELIDLMEDKFDSMIYQLSTGNDISDKLLRNSMV